MHVGSAKQLCRECAQLHKRVAFSLKNTQRLMPKESSKTAQDIETVAILCRIVLWIEIPQRRLRLRRLQLPQPPVGVLTAAFSITTSKSRCQVATGLSRTSQTPIIDLRRRRETRPTGCPWGPTSSGRAAEARKTSPSSWRILVSVGSERGSSICHDGGSGNRRPWS